MDQFSTSNNDNSLPMEYNYYPTPQRSETLARLQLNGKDFPIRKFKQIDTNRTFSLNNYNLDIEGSAPRRFGVLNQKPHYGYTNLDIEKSSPSPVYKFTEKFDYSNTNLDIEGTRPRGHHCFKTNRHLDPLNPVYTLPTTHAKCPILPSEYKFIRDQIRVDDIEGTQGKYKAMLKSNMRDNMDKYRSMKDDDLLLNYLGQLKGNKMYNSMDYRDIYDKRSFSTRHTNPLAPAYKFDGTEHGPIEGTKPSVFSKFHLEKVNKGNSTDDIKGAQPSTKSSYAKFELKHNHPRFYKPEEIAGTNSGSLLKGIKTNRCLNPLTPNYKPLGEEGTGLNFGGRRDLKVKYDYGSLMDFYKEHAKDRVLIVDYKKHNEMLKNNKQSEEKNNDNSLNINKEKYYNISNENKTIDINTNKEDVKTKAENYIKKLQSENNDGDYDKDNYPDPNILNKRNDKVKFDPELYKKPEDYMGLKHDGIIYPTIPKAGKSKLEHFKHLSEGIIEMDKGNKDINMGYKRAYNKNDSLEQQLDSFIKRVNE